jgi:hypothetical protein
MGGDTVVARYECGFGIKEVIKSESVYLRSSNCTISCAQVMQTQATVQKSDCRLIYDHV